MNGAISTPPLPDIKPAPGKPRHHGGMTPVKLEGTLVRLLRRAADGRGFLAVCAALAFASTATASFPVTAVVLPAALLAPTRWRAITVCCALGSAAAATMLVMGFHHLGWSALYERFPEMLTHPQWHRVMGWAARYGIAALFVIAVSPLPQTPALVFFGATQHDYLGVAAAMFAGKLVKYGALAWMAARFPERFTDGLGALFGRRPS